jgi:hypothetical protein
VSAPLRLTSDDIARIPRGEIASIITMLAARLLEPNGNDDGAASDDVMLTVLEASKILRRSQRWIWRHQTLPFVKKLSPRSLLISKVKLLKWLEQRK